MSSTRKSNNPRPENARRDRPSAADVPALLPVVVAPWWQWWIAAAIVCAAAIAAYIPTLNNDFVTWDDPDYITKNEYVVAPDGLSKIWNPGAKQQQYYPMVFSSYWLEHRLWGFEPRGYHLTNMVLHAINAGLLIGVLRLLGLNPWAAWLAAALFALHPINAGSVAWAAERKNVLSGLFYLLSLMCLLRNTRRPSWPVYGVSLLLFVLGLLSKTTVVTLPATAVLCDQLILRRWSWRSLARVAPMLALGLLAAWNTHRVELANSTMSMDALEPLLRPLAAAGAIWFYVGKIFVPFHFAGVYPRWDVRGSWPVFTLALAALPVAGYAVWRLRRRLSGHAVWGMGHYLLTLVPVLGLIPFNHTQFSFVADHFMYLPGIGVFVAIAAGANYVRRQLGNRWLRTVASTGVACVVLAGLGVVCWRQNATAWRDARAFWEHTISLDPNSWVGHYNLANLNIRENRLADAAEQYRLATLARPDRHQGYGRWAETLVQLGDLEGAAKAYRHAIEAVSFPSRSWTDYRHQLADVLVRLNRLEEAEKWLREVAQRKPQLDRGYLKLATFLHGQSRFEEAVKCYEQALKVNPNLDAARRGLEAAQQARQRIPPGSPGK